MHASAQAHLELCVTKYLRQGRRYDIVDLGSQTDPGVSTVRDMFADFANTFVGLDVVDGPNVDVVMRKPYRLPVKSGSVDVLITCQTFEHIPFPWATMLEIARVLRPDGLVFFSAPSRGHPHASMDSWRYYPDALRSLAAFSRLRLIEAHTDMPPRKPQSRRFDYPAIDDRYAYWGDTVGIFRKPKRYSRAIRPVREVVVWWANRVGGIEGIPRPTPVKERRQVVGQLALADGAAASARAATAGAPTTAVHGIDVTEVSFDGHTYLVPGYARHRSVAKHILAREHAEPELNAFVAQAMAERPGSMVHAGTFFGDMLPSFAALCPGTLYAFEPVLENYLLARETVARNELGNVMLFHAGLGASAAIGAIETSDGKRHTGGGSKIVRDVAKPLHRPQQVPLLPIDQFDIQDLTLLQLDVEGHESFVLDGAVRTIERCRPMIVVEDNRRNCEPLLESLGYREARKVDARNRLYLPAGSAS